MVAAKLEEALKTQDEPSIKSARVEKDDAISNLSKGLGPQNAAMLKAFSVLLDEKLDKKVESLTTAMTVIAEACDTEIECLSKKMEDDKKEQHEAFVTCESNSSNAIAKATEVQAELRTLASQMQELKIHNETVLGQLNVHNAWPQGGMGPAASNGASHHQHRPSLPPGTSGDGLPQMVNSDPPAYIGNVGWDTNSGMIVENIKILLTACGVEESKNA